METNISSISFFNPLYIESASFLKKENKVFQIFTNISEQFWSNPNSNKVFHVYHWGSVEKDIETVNKVMHIGLLILLGLALVKYTLPAAIFLLISALSKISNRMYPCKVDITNIENLIKDCIDKMSSSVAKERASINLIKHYLSKNTTEEYQTAISIIDTYPWTNKTLPHMCVIEYYLRKTEPNCAAAYIKSITHKLDIPTQQDLYEPILYHLINNCRFRECESLMIALDLTKVDNPLGVKIIPLLKKHKEFKTFETLTAFFTKDYDARVGANKLLQARKEKLQIAAIKFYLAIDLVEKAQNIITTSLRENPGSDLESNGVKARGDELIFKYHLEKNSINLALDVIENSYPVIYHENNTSCLVRATGTSSSRGNHLFCKGDFQVDFLRHLGKEKPPLLDQAYQSFMTIKEKNDEDSHRKRALERAYVLAKIDCGDLEKANELLDRQKDYIVSSALVDYYLAHGQTNQAKEIANSHSKPENELLLSRITPEKPRETRLDKMGEFLKKQNFEAADAEIRRINNINSTEYVDAIFAFFESAKNQMMTIR